MRWLKIRYIAYTLPDNQIIDFSKDSLVVPIGKDLLARELENILKDAEIGKSYNIILKKPYGERSESNIKILPTVEFSKRNINPIPGLVVLVNGMQGIVRSINSGRVIVDFNHPLAGKDILYNISVLEEVKDLREKILGILNLFFKININDVNLEISEKNIKIGLKQGKLPEKCKEILKKYVEELNDYEIIIS